MKLLIIAVTAVLCALSVYGTDFYIDEYILLADDGTAYIKGEANIDVLSIIKVKDGAVEGNTQELTLKEGLLWKFVYTTKTTLASYRIVLFLPEFSEIQSIESTGRTAIGIKDDRHMITFEGENMPLTIEVGYVVPKTTKKTDYSWIYIFGIFLLIAVIGFFIIKKISKKPSKKTSQVLDDEKIKTIKMTLNENQLKILEALIEKKGEASQTALKYLTGIPKSSLSRNLELMSQRNIVAKFYSGTSNYVKIHPSLYK